MEKIDCGRRTFCGGAAVSLAAMPLAIAHASGVEAAQLPQEGRPAPGAAFGPIKQARAGLLDVAYAEDGPANGPPVILLHGWPYDIHSFVEVAPMLAAKGNRVIVPYIRGYGPTRFLSGDTMRSGEPAATAKDLVDLMDALAIRSAVLAGFDWGARTGDIVAALWPDRVKGLVSVSGYLIGNPATEKMPLPPQAEYQWWYQFYFATDRGKLGYERNARDFNKLIWQLASPQWKFDDATYERSAASFENPDHSAIVIHNYRWRLGLADGDPRYNEINARLAAAPNIAVQTITMEGGANGAPHPPPAAYRAKFTGKYEHRTSAGGIGHNLPQEDPKAFAKAVLDVS